MSARISNGIHGIILFGIPGPVEEIPEEMSVKKCREPLEKLLEEEFLKESLKKFLKESLEDFLKQIP